MLELMSHGIINLTVVSGINEFAKLRLRESNIKIQRMRLWECNIKIQRNSPQMLTKTCIFHSVEECTDKNQHVKNE